MQQPSAFCPGCGARQAAPTPFCAQCGRPLGAAPAFAPHPGSAPHFVGQAAPYAGHAPLVAPTGGGPAWPYPEPAQRTTSSFDSIFGYAFVGAGVFALAMGAFILPMVGPDPMALFMIAIFAFTFPAIGIGSLRAARKNKRTAQELTTQGVRCWGRILSVAPGGSARSVNGMRWAQMKITVEAFAAPDPRGAVGYRQQGPGARVADQVVIDWYVSMFQMALLQPGYWCAFLLHPSDPSKVYLDSFATPQGQVVALT